MKKLIQVAVVLLLFTSIVSVSFAGVSANASNADRGTSLYLTRLETFYDVKATSVPVYCVVADFSDSIISAPPRYITSVTAHMPWGTETKEGMWRPLRVSGLLNKETWDNAWTSFCRPGVKNKSQIESVKPIERLLKDASSYDLILIQLPVEPEVGPGHRTTFTVVAALSDGTTVEATGTMIAQSISAPAGWINGDTHIHTDIEGTLQRTEIRNMAQSYGHEFTYITDHLDLIRTSSKLNGSTANQKWASWWNLSQTHSLVGYTMCPGIEVTAKDANGDGTADGDVLGYKMPSANPTNIDNLSMTSANLVSAIHAANTNAAVFAAHPDGGLGAGIPTAVMSAGYDGAQAVEFGEDFWESSINSGFRTAASGGSDAHWGWQFVGQSTWAYAPSWSPTGSWSNNVNAIADAMKSGTIAASSDGSFGYFRIANSLPGAYVSARTGSTIYYDIDARALNNGYTARIIWDLYRGSTRVNGGTSSILPSGGVLQLSSLSTIVQSGTRPYFLNLRFDYMDGIGTVFSSTVLCGPVYVTGT